MSRSSSGQALTRTYLTADPRSLGVARIVLGLVLIGDLLRRVPLLRDFYTNEGLLPNHTVLWRPPLPRLFSGLFPVSLMHEAVLVSAIALFCYVCLLIGWRTRLFHLASFLLAISLHNRALFVESWGPPALAVVMVWTAFLPLGRRFSVDAVLASLRARPDEGPGDLAPGRLPPPDNRPVVSLAVLGVLLQLALIYGLNFLQRDGATWKDGSAAHYLLWQERIVTPLGVWLRAHAPLGILRAVTFSTLAIEAAVPLLVLTPLFWRWTRLLAIVLVLALQVGGASLLSLGLISSVMLAYLPLLLDTRHWDWLARHVPTRGRRRLVFYDASCGVCFLVVRVLARLDVHRRLTWISNQDQTALPADVKPELLEATILVVDPARNRRWTRSDGFAQIFAALPLGRLWAWPLVLPGLAAIARRAYDAFAHNRTAISSALGLAACALPVAPTAPSPDAPATPQTPTTTTTPATAWVRSQLPRLRELGAALVLLLIGAEVLGTNAAVPPDLRWTSRPDWMRVAVMYPHLDQKWAMFAPDAPTSEQMIVFDALTREGRHVDPYNQVASRVAALPVDDIPPLLQQPALYRDYTLRIATVPDYNQALTEWMMRYPERTGRALDGVVSFDGWLMRRDTPPPGANGHGAISKQLFIRWPAGGRR